MKLAASTLIEEIPESAGVRSKLAQLPELFFDFIENQAGQWQEFFLESLIVDSPALVDHHFALLIILGDSFRENDADQAVGAKRNTGPAPVRR